MADASETPAPAAPSDIQREGQAAAVWWPVERLVPWVRNPKAHTAETIAAMAKKMRRFGFGGTIVVWKNAARHQYSSGQIQVKGDRISVGHRRRLAARLIWQETPDFVFPGAPGPGYVPVRFVEYKSEAEFEKAAASDDADPSEYDPEKLRDILQEHARGGNGIEAESPVEFGFTETRIKEYLGAEVSIAELEGRASAAADKALAAAAGSGTPPGRKLGLPGQEAVTKVPAVVVGKRRLPMTPDDERRMEEAIRRHLDVNGSPHGFVKRVLDALVAAETREKEAREGAPRPAGDGAAS